MSKLSLKSLRKFGKVNPDGSITVTSKKFARRFISVVLREFDKDIKIVLLESNPASKQAKSPLVEFGGKIAYWLQKALTKAVKVRGKMQKLAAQAEKELAKEKVEFTVNTGKRAKDTHIGQVEALIGGKISADTGVFKSNLKRKVAEKLKAKIDSLKMDFTVTIEKLFPALTKEDAKANKKALKKLEKKDSKKFQKVTQKIDKKLAKVPVTATVEVKPGTAPQVLEDICKHFGINASDSFYAGGKTGTANVVFKSRKQAKKSVKAAMKEWGSVGLTASI